VQGHVGIPTLPQDHTRGGRKERGRGGGRGHERGRRGEITGLGLRLRLGVCVPDGTFRLLGHHGDERLKGWREGGREGGREDLIL